jgi:hypothetical protein
MTAHRRISSGGTAAWSAATSGHSPGRTPSGSFDESSDGRLTAQRLRPRIASAPAGLSAAERDLWLLIAWPT